MKAKRDDVVRECAEQKVERIDGPILRDNRERREEEEKKNTHKKNVIGFHIKLGFRIWDCASHFFLVRARAQKFVAVLLPREGIGDRSFFLSFYDGRKFYRRIYKECALTLES